MCPELEKYIGRYYDDWLRCARRWCYTFGIANEAYDLFMDVLLDLCQKSDTKLREMIAWEEAGNPMLFFYVRKAIRLTIYQYRRRARRFIALDVLLNLLPAAECDDVTDELFARFREVEAAFRADDFIDAGLFEGNGKLHRYVVRIKTKHGYRLQVRYTVTSTTGLRRQFCKRTDALAFLTGQNPPPRKIEKKLNQSYYEQQNKFRIRLSTN